MNTWKKAHLSTGDIALAADCGIIESGSALWPFGRNTGEENGEISFLLRIAGGFYGKKNGEKKNISVECIHGCRIGADDYIAKPFDPAELVARVNANLRQYERLQGKALKESGEEPEEIRIRDLRILVNSWKVYKGDKEIKFPNREFEILKFFAMNPNIVFSKEQILETVWGAGYRLNK